MSSWVVRCAPCYLQLRAQGVPEGEATLRASRDADNIENTAAHVAEHGHNEWERADKADNEGWVLAPWESIGQYVGRMDYSNWPRNENGP